VMQQFALYTAAGGTLLGDYSHRATSLTFATNAHGFAELAATIPMGAQEAFQFYDRAGTPHALFNDASSGALYEGRVEDVAIVPDGIRITALGYARAFTDLPHTNIWSTTDITPFRPLYFAENANYTPESYVFGVQNGQLTISPLKGVGFGTYG